MGISKWSKECPPKKNNEISHEAKSSRLEKKENGLGDVEVYKWKSPLPETSWNSPIASEDSTDLNKSSEDEPVELSKNC